MILHCIGSQSNQQNKLTMFSWGRPWHQSVWRMVLPKRKVLPDHFEEHVPMTIDFNWDLNDWSIQRRAHSRRFKKVFFVSFVSPRSKENPSQGCHGYRNGGTVQVGVLPRDPSHGQQRGGADRGGAAVSGARRHLSSPGAATRSGRWGSWRSWLTNGWVYGDYKG